MRITRHARNNIRLYHIAIADVEQTIQRPEWVEHEENRISAYRAFPGKHHEQPLKVVYSIEGSEIILITAYPLRRKVKGR